MNGLDSPLLSLHSCMMAFKQSFLFHLCFEILISNPAFFFNFRTILLRDHPFKTSANFSQFLIPTPLPLEVFFTTKGQTISERIYGVRISPSFFEKNCYLGKTLFKYYKYFTVHFLFSDTFEDDHESSANNEYCDEEQGKFCSPNPSSIYSWFIKFLND